MSQKLTKSPSSTKAALVKPSRELGFSKIYLDMLAGSAPAADMYVASSLDSVATQLDGLSFDRDRLVAILNRQNREYGASPETLANIEKFRDERAVAIFSGQQAGLFGGPLLTLIKALGIVKAAREYSHTLDRPVIPVFWIAGDDHDFEEANHTFVHCQEMDVCRVAYESAPEIELSTAEITFSDRAALAEAKEALKGHLGQTDFTDELYALMDRCYTSDDTFATAFGKLMAELTSGLGLVFFCPADREAKELALPLFRSIIDQQVKLHETLETTNQQISDAGYHIQVEKKDNATHLFYNLDGRKPLLRDGDMFTVGEARFTHDELMARIQQHPEKVSPDVMTRPILQSFLFPTVSQRGGPAEIAYLAQINPLFALFGLPAPLHAARPSLTLLESRFEKLLGKHAVKFEELAGDIEQVINRVLAESFPPSIEADFNKLRETVAAEFGKFSDEILAFDRALQKTAEQTRGKIDFAIKGLEGKVFATHKRHSQETRERIYRLYKGLYPNRGFQERSLNISYFLAKYGPGIVEFMYDQMDSEQTDHQVISLTEYKA